MPCQALVCRELVVHSALAFNDKVQQSEQLSRQRMAAVAPTHKEGLESATEGRAVAGKAILEGSELVLAVQIATHERGEERDHGG